MKFLKTLTQIILILGIISAQQYVDDDYTEGQKIYCKSVPQSCEETYQPVCGYKQDGTQQTYYNGCNSCLDNAEYYTINECESNHIQDTSQKDMYMLKCPLNRQSICNEQFEDDGYCGIFFRGQTNDKGEKYQSSYGNFCQACSDEKVNFVFKGNCNNFIDNKENTDLQISFCEDDIPETCDNQYSAVCGYQENGEYITQTNKCNSCKKNDTFYFQHECSIVITGSSKNFYNSKLQKCPSIEERQTNCSNEQDGRGYCGMTGEQKGWGVVQKAGFRNACQACADFEILEFYAGECVYFEQETLFGDKIQLSFGILVALLLALLY